MDPTDIVVLGLFVVACLLAVYQSRAENWTINRKIGAVISLVGVAIALFLDDLLAASSPIHPWIEPVAAAIMAVGLLVSWFWHPD